MSRCGITTWCARTSTSRCRCGLARPRSAAPPRFPSTCWSPSTTSTRPTSSGTGRGEFRDAAIRGPTPCPLVVEARSPSTWRFDIGAKKAGYERAGLPELWLVDTKGDVVLVFRRSSAQAGFDVALELTASDTLASPLLPGFELPVSAVFASRPDVERLQVRFAQFSEVA